MLNHFIFTILDPKVKYLDIFCDSCSGQNKNYLVIKFLPLCSEHCKAAGFDQNHVSCMWPLVHGLCLKYGLNKPKISL